MRFIILTQYYLPETGAPQRRLSDLAQRLTDQGHQVTILTAMPNYPTGKIFPDYGGWLRREIINGISVIRTLIYPTQKATFPHRLANYFSFVISSAIVGLFALPKADVLLVESPPLFLGLSAWWLSRLKRAKLIFNVSDLWPESVAQLGLIRRDSLTYHISQLLEHFCYQQAWIISGQTRGIIADIQARFPNKAVFHLTNGVDIDQFGSDKFQAEVRASLAAPDELIVMYAGLHGLAQGVDQLIEAAHALQDERIRFILIGDGPEKGMLIRQAQEMQLANVNFLDSRPGHEIPPLLAVADMIVVPLRLNIPSAVPSKLYEAMASAKPAIVVSVGEAAMLTNEFQLGRAIEPGDIAALVAAIQELAGDAALRRQMGQRGRLAIEQHFNREHIAQRFSAYIQERMAAH